MSDTLLNNPLELRKALGIVSGMKRKRGRPAKPKVPLPGIEEVSTSVMTATDTDLPETLERHQPLSTFVNDTTLSSLASTVWTAILIGYVESGSPRITDDQWESLPSVFQIPLEQLADGRSEHPYDTVQIIIEYLVETDLAEAPILEGIAFYLDNEII